MGGYERGGEERVCRQYQGRGQQEAGLPLRELRFLDDEMTRPWCAAPRRVALDTRAGCASESAGYRYLIHAYHEHGEIMFDGLMNCQ